MNGADWSKRYPRIVEDAARLKGSAVMDAEVLHSSGLGTDHLTVRSLNEHHQRQGLVMGLFTKDIESMDDLFLHGLMDTPKNRSSNRCQSSSRRPPAAI
jgi:hypothetical protein